MLPLLALVRRYVLPGRVGMIILSALVAHTAWHWMLERAEALWSSRGRDPGGADIAVLALWLGFILLAAGGLKHVAKLPALAGRSSMARPSTIPVEGRVRP